MFGSTRFMAPEEFQLGARIDERTTVFSLGRAAFVFLGERGTPPQRAAATRACSPDPAARFATVEAFLTAWSGR
jgi:serine/threonine-protein kinase